ncbi:Alstrom syndrome protein 1 [Trichoplax sp. H2]|nr:Alstrom syndrome protein 1 [Trichoplax sp. H2]|eukprot:RDD43513.1 Alstrom syndrome protein 1 [Trichoplax sp. H2]
MDTAKETENQHTIQEDTQFTPPVQSATQESPPHQEKVESLDDVKTDEIQAKLFNANDVEEDDHDRNSQSTKTDTNQITERQSKEKQSDEYVQDGRSLTDQIVMEHDRKQDTNDDNDLIQFDDDHEKDPAMVDESNINLKHQELVHPISHHSNPMANATLEDEQGATSPTSAYLQDETKPRHETDRHDEELPMKIDTTDDQEDNNINPLNSNSRDDPLSDSAVTNPPSTTEDAKYESSDALKVDDLVSKYLGRNFELSKLESNQSSLNNELNHPDNNLHPSNFKELSPGTYKLISQINQLLDQNNKIQLNIGDESLQFSTAEAIRPDGQRTSRPMQGEYADLLYQLESDRKRLDTSKDKNSLSKESNVDFMSSRVAQDDQGDRESSDKAIEVDAQSKLSSSFNKTVESSILFKPNSPLDILSSLHSHDLSSKVTAANSRSFGRNDFNHTDDNSTENKSRKRDWTNLEKNVFNENLIVENSSADVQNANKKESKSSYLHSSLIPQERNRLSDEEDTDLIKPLRNNWINSKHQNPMHRPSGESSTKYTGSPLKTWRNEFEDLSSSDDDDYKISNLPNSDSLPLSNVADIIAKYIRPLNPIYNVSISTESSQSSQVRSPLLDKSNKLHNRYMLNSESDSETSDGIATYRQAYAENLSRYWSEYKDSRLHTEEISEPAQTLKNSQRYLTDFDEIISNPTKHILSSLIDNNTQSNGMQKDSRKYKRNVTGKHHRRHDQQSGTDANIIKGRRFVNIKINANESNKIDYPQILEISDSTTNNETLDENNETRSSSDLDIVSDIEKIVQKYSSGNYPIVNNRIRSEYFSNSNDKSVQYHQNSKMSKNQSSRNKIMKDPTNQLRSDVGNDTRTTHGWLANYYNTQNEEDKLSHKHSIQKKQLNNSAKAVDTKVNKSIQTTLIDAMGSKLDHQSNARPSDQDKKQMQKSNESWFISLDDNKPGKNWKHLPNEKTPDYVSTSHEEPLVANVSANNLKPSYAKSRLLPPKSLARLTLQEAFQFCKADFIVRSKVRLKNAEVAAKQRREKEELLLRKQRTHMQEKAKPTAKENLVDDFLPRKRYFTKKEMYEQTRRLYKELPEVKLKEKQKKIDEKKKENRIRLALYKKKITSRLHNRILAIHDVV